MTFISYAQNCEDLMLHRALGDIEDGFYVDVGAQHAVRDSVTAAFYVRGWHGINVEPIPKWARLLRKMRPRDINLQLAIDPRADELEIHEVPGGLSTVVHDYAARYRSEGKPVQRRRVPAARLDEILETHAARDIHFLKIDVEGAERAVLESLSLTRFRPWILLIEATRPGTSEVAFQEWEPLVTAAGYQRVYWDGLNLFYVADEHMARAAAFASPPNVFDSVQLAETIRTITRFARRAEIAKRRRADALRTLDTTTHEVVESRNRLGELESWNADLVQQGRRALAIRLQQAGELATLSARASRVSGLEHELATLRGSASWLVTAPLRLAGSVMRRQIGIVDAGKKAARGAIRLMWSRIRHRTAWAQRLQRMAAFHPRAYRWLQYAATGGQPGNPLDASRDDLCARARHVFEQLQGRSAAERS